MYKYGNFTEKRKTLYNILIVYKQHFLLTVLIFKFFSRILSLSILQLQYKTHKYGFHLCIHCTEQFYYAFLLIMSFTARGKKEEK